MHSNWSVNLIMCPVSFQEFICKQTNKKNRCGWTDLIPAHEKWTEPLPEINCRHLLITICGQLKKFSKGENYPIQILFPSLMTSFTSLCCDMPDGKIWGGDEVKIPVTPFLQAICLSIILQHHKETQTVWLCHSQLVWTKEINAEPLRINTCSHWCDRLCCT